MTKKNVSSPTAVEQFPQGQGRTKMAGSGSPDAKTKAKQKRFMNALFRISDEHVKNTDRPTILKKKEKVKTANASVSTGKTGSMSSAHDSARRQNSFRGLSMENVRAAGSKMATSMTAVSTGIAEKSVEFVTSFVDFAGMACKARDDHVTQVPMSESGSISERTDSFPTISWEPTTSHVENSAPQSGADLEQADSFESFNATPKGVMNRLGLCVADMDDAESTVADEDSKVSAHDSSPAISWEPTTPRFKNSGPRSGADLEQADSFESFPMAAKEIHSLNGVVQETHESFELELSQTDTLESLKLVATGFMGPVGSVSDIGQLNDKNEEPPNTATRKTEHDLPMQSPTSSERQFNETKADVVTGQKSDKGQVASNVLRDNIASEPALQSPVSLEQELNQADTFESFNVVPTGFMEHMGCVTDDASPKSDQGVMNQTNAFKSLNAIPVEFMKQVSYVEDVRNEMKDKAVSRGYKLFPACGDEAELADTFETFKMAPKGFLEHLECVAQVGKDAVAEKTSQMKTRYGLSNESPTEDGRDLKQANTGSFNGCVLTCGDDGDETSETNGITIIKSDPTKVPDRKSSQVKASATGEIMNLYGCVLVVDDDDGYADRVNRSRKCDEKSRVSIKRNESDDLQSPPENCGRGPKLLREPNSIEESTTFGKYSADSGLVDTDEAVLDQLMEKLARKDDDAERKAKNRRFRGAEDVLLTSNENGFLSDQIHKMGDMAETLKAPFQGKANDTSSERFRRIEDTVKALEEDIVSQDNDDDDVLRHFREVGDDSSTISPLPSLQQSVDVDDF